jgi:hypothetical protein
MRAKIKIFTLNIDIDNLIALSGVISKSIRETDAKKMDDLKLMYQPEVHL